MSADSDKLRNLKARQAAWEHVRDVLTLPAFWGLYHMVTNCMVIEKLLMEYEANQVRLDDGTTYMTNHLELTALSDYWILGFFEIMRITKSCAYRQLAEFPFDKELKALHKKATFVRSAFAKLAPPGRSDRILPSHSGMGPEGTIYAVYDGKGNEVVIRRRELADIFLLFLGRYTRSRQYDQWMKRVLSVSEAKGRYDSTKDGPTDLEFFTWQIEGVLSNRRSWDLDASNLEMLTEGQDKRFRDSLLKAELKKNSADSDWDASRLAKALRPST